VLSYFDITSVYISQAAAIVYNIVHSD